MIGPVLQHMGVGERQERDFAQSVFDRGGRAHHAARRRAAADIHLLAEADLETQHVGYGLRPEDVAGAGAGHPRHHEPIDLVLFNAGAVEQRLEHFTDQDENVAVAFLHHLGFGVGHDRVVTQAHRFTPSNS